jgi:hypothetical protein
MIEDKNGKNLYRSFKSGGKVDESTAMVLSQNKAIAHHTEELKKAIAKNKKVEPWVIGKMQRATTDMSDVTHYFDGMTEYAKGGRLKEFKVGDKVIYALNGKWFTRNKQNFKSGEITKVEVINGVKVYTIEFKNRFGILIDTQKTNNTKEIEIDQDEEMANGGMMADGGGIGEPEDYHKLNMEFLKIFSEYGFINAVNWGDNHYINEKGDILSWSPKSKTIGKGWLIVRLSKTYPYEMHSEISKIASNIQEEHPDFKINYESESYKRWVIKVYLKSYTINNLIKLFNEFNFKKGKTKENLSFTPYYASGGMMADGGDVQGVDLFEDYDDQPQEVQAILANYDMEDNDYETLQNLKSELESIGYTFDFGLDAEPYDLRKIGEKGKSEFYAKGGKVRWQDVYVGDNALVIAENKMGMVVKPYGRRFHLRFPDGSEKTYSAEELEFFKDEEYAKGGKIKVDGEDFSFLLGLSDRELSKRLDLVRKQKDINAKQYFSAKGKGESTTKIEQSGKNLDNQERAIIEARVRNNKTPNSKIMTLEEFKKTLPDVISPFWGENDIVYKAKYNQYAGRTMYYKNGRRVGEPISVNYAYNESYLYFANKNAKKPNGKYVTKQNVLNLVVKNPNKNGTEKYLSIKPKDFLDGLHEFAKGGKLTDDYTYIKRSEVEHVIYRDSNGKEQLDFKPKNGFWVSKKALVDAGMNETKAKFDAKEVANELIALSTKAWDTLSIQSGSEIYASDDLQENLADEYRKVGIDKIYGQLTQPERKKVSAVLTDENEHSLRNYLALRGYNGEAEFKNYAKMYDDSFAKFGYRSNWNPKNVDLKLGSFAKGGMMADGGVIEEGDDVFVKPEKLNAEVVRITGENVVVEFYDRRPEGGEKRGNYKIKDLKKMANGGMMAKGGKAYYLKPQKNIDKLFERQKKRLADMRRNDDQLMLLQGINYLNKKNDEDEEKYIILFFESETPFTRFDLEYHREKLINLGYLADIDETYLVTPKGEEYLKQHNEKELARKMAKGGMMADGGVIEEGDDVFVKPEKLNAEVVRITGENVVVEFYDRRPEGGEKRGNYKIKDLKKMADGGIMAKGGSISDGDKLPEDMGRYFIKTKSTKVVKMADLIPLRKRATGIANAEKNMKMAYDGEMDKRKPITIYKSQRKYRIMDGNSTYAVAKANGWENIWAEIVKNPNMKNGLKRTDDIFTRAKSIRKEGEAWKDALQRAKTMKQ